MRKTTVFLSVVVGLLCLGAVGTMAPVGNGEALANAGEQVETLVYFTRHAEDEVALVQPVGSARALLSDCHPFLDDGELDECCLEVLSSLGQLRATLLAKWFWNQGITETVTHVIASHKTRTRQTVEAIASDAGLDGDVDLNPGDGVQQVPAFAQECDSGFEKASSSRGPMVEAIEALPLGSVAVVGAHSGTLYKIMDALGIDTSDEMIFPRNPDGKVKGYNNLWIVSLDAGGSAVLVEHLVIDFELAVQVAD